MTLANLRILNEWAASNKPILITRSVEKRIRECCKLLSVPVEFCDDINSDNFAAKVEYLRTIKKAASDALGTTLLSAYEQEDAGNVAAGIAILEEYLRIDTADGYKSIAQNELSRLRKSLPE